MNYTLHHGDCLDILRTLPDNSVDAIVTDPPYGLSFMGKRWDYDVPSEDIWRECLRVLKPGGHLLAFAGTRTQHRMAVRIEDAGFEIRDMIAWVYGSGFPKSLDVSKAIDKASGAEREVVGVSSVIGKRRNQGIEKYGSGNGIPESVNNITAPATPAARQWHGWGTALKPALEPITVARKPLIGTVAENVLTWGTGGVNVDASRVGGEQGRWPANLIHDGSDEVVGLFPKTESHGGGTSQKMKGWDKPTGSRVSVPVFREKGSAARFFYCAKASKRDRGEGCEGMPLKKSIVTTMQADQGMPMRMENGLATGPKAPPRIARNHHPTVKPTDLMRYLCRLVTPPEGTVLDPFMGSGSTGKAALLEDFDFIGIEREAEYLDIARARIEHAINNKPNKLL